MVNGKKINFLIATWSGKRRNPSRDYLKQQLNRLFQLKHNLDQVTIIVPAGSDDPEFYNIPGEILSKCTILHRPENDRAQGQQIFAYKEYRGQFDYYIINEDDYIPNIDNFDSILIDILGDADYLCGKFGHTNKADRDHVMEPYGIIRQASFEKALQRNPGISFPPNGTGDGTELHIWTDFFKGMNIVDYSDKYPVPYWDRTLRYYSESRSAETLFVPYQLLHKKAFTYDLERNKTYHPEDEHFLSGIEFLNIKLLNIDQLEGHASFAITQWNENIGTLMLERTEGKLYADTIINKHGYSLIPIVFEKLVYENRCEAIYKIFDRKNPLSEDFKKSGWIEHEKDGIFITLKKKYA